MTTTHTVILDGFLGRSRRWGRLCRTIEAHGGSASIHRYDSTGRLDLPTLAGQLSRACRGLGRPVNFVGYSMGGLVIRTASLLESLRMERAVFINTPHRGTLAAYLWPLVGVRQMRPGDPLLARLAAAAWDVPTLTVYNRFDGVVVPAASTRFDKGGEHFPCPVPAHVWPVWSKRVHRRVAEFLAAPGGVV